MFYILGLPRSRTAWLSEFLSDKNGKCLHEGLYYYPKYNLPLNVCGDATTVYPLIKNYINNADKIVIIDRDIEEVKTSLGKLFPDFKMDSLYYLKNSLDKINSGLRIPFDEINIRLPQIWETCKNTCFSNERAEYFMKSHIENTSLLRKLQCHFG